MIRERLTRLITAEDGQAAVEYGLIAAALIVGLFATATGLIKLQGAVYQNQHQALQNWRSP